MYIDLLKKSLIDLHRIQDTEYKPLYLNNKKIGLKILRILDGFLRKKGLSICHAVDFNREHRMEGKDWPANADSMIGLKRMNNIEFCINQIIQDNIPGDFIETGVWRGGATIFMKALLKANDINDRVVWVADSFEGLPAPNESKYIADKGDKHYLRKELAVSLETVKGNFLKYDLLDENVKFLKGWFKDTLPTAPIDQLSLLRLDGDMYESTMDALNALYPKLSVGGYLIVDDWGAIQKCRQAVEDYRNAHGITNKIETIDWTGAYWRK